MFGAVAGGEGDLETNIVKHPSEKANCAKVPSSSSVFQYILAENIISKLEYMGPMIFATTIALVKVSTLILYKRIFVTKGFQLACHITMVLTASWFLTSILVGILSPPWIGPFDEDYIVGRSLLIQTTLQWSERPTGPCCYQLLCISALHGCDQRGPGRIGRMHALVCSTNNANVHGPQSTGVWSVPTGLLVISVRFIILLADNNSANPAVSLPQPYGSTIFN